MTQPSLPQHPRSYSLYASHHGRCYFDSACYDYQTQIIQDTNKTVEGTVLKNEFWPLSKIPQKAPQLAKTSFDFQVSLLMVSKHLREEGLEVFYKTNTFSFGHPNWFNIFASRITDGRASLLGQVEFYSDIEWFVEDWATWTLKPFFFDQDLQPNNVLSKLANVRKITIEVCDSDPWDHDCNWESVKMDKESLMEERLQREFGALARLERVESATVIPRFRMCRHELNNDNVPSYRMAEVMMGDIGDRFATMLMDTAG